MTKRLLDTPILVNEGGRIAGQSDPESILSRERMQKIPLSYTSL